jgi:hypothetical protein
MDVMTIRDFRILETWQETCDPNAIARRLSDLTDAVDDLTTLCQKRVGVQELRKNRPEFIEALKKMHDLAIETMPVNKGVSA